MFTHKLSTSEARLFFVNIHSTIWYGLFPPFVRHLDSMEIVADSSIHYNMYIFASVRFVRPQNNVKLV